MKYFYKNVYKKLIFTKTVELQMLLPKHRKYFTKTFYIKTFLQKQLNCKCYYLSIEKILPKLFTLKTFYIKSFLRKQLNCKCYYLSMKNFLQTVLFNYN